MGIREYLTEVKMSPKQIAKTFGKEILKMLETGYGRLKGSDVDNLSVVVFDFLQKEGFANIAEKMSDEDLKETARIIIKKYGE